MKKQKLIIAFLIIFIIGGFFVFQSAFAQGEVEVEDVESLQDIIPELRVPIPDLPSRFQEPATITKNERTYVIIPWIAQYISAIYRYSLGIAAIAAVLAVMIGGILYLTSGGYPQRIEQGKNIIIGAITGLVIIVFSYVFLNFINPELVRLRPIAMESIRPELLTVGNYCVDLPDGGVEVLAGGKWVAPTQGNNSLFRCKKDGYRVRSKPGSACTVAEGQTCVGKYCERGICDEEKGECVDALFRIRLTGQTLRIARNIDDFEIWGIKDNVAVQIHDRGARGETSFNVLKTKELEKEIKKYEKIFFWIELNDVNAYADWARFANAENKNLLTMMAEVIKGIAEPSYDDVFFAVKHYENANKAIWGLPAPIVTAEETMIPICEPCKIIEREEDWTFKVSKPWCNFWTPTEILNVPGGLEVEINVDDFPEDPDDPDYLSHYEYMPCGAVEGCDLTKKPIKIEEVETSEVLKVLSEGPSGAEVKVTGNIMTEDECAGLWFDANFMGPVVGGASCKIDELFTEKPGLNDQQLSCRPVSASEYEWSGGQEGEACDNAGEADITDGFPMVPDDTSSRTCQSGLTCQWMIETPETCSSGTNVQYCFGRCYEQGFSSGYKPGDPCPPSGICPAYNDQQMYCVESANECSLGEVGDKCDENGDCGSGRVCVDSSQDKLCAPNNAGNWQVCGNKVGADGTNCGNGYECVEPVYHDDPGNPVGCQIQTNYGESDLKICFDPTKNDESNGLCFCNNNDECLNAYSWQIGETSAFFCSLAGNTNYCSVPTEGGWCRHEGIEPSRFKCKQISGEYGILIEK